MTVYGEMRAAPEDLAGLAGAMLDAVLEFSELWRIAQDDLALSAEAFGNVADVKQVHQNHVAVVEEAGTTIGRFGAVYELDVDRVYRTAFAYQEADRDVAEQLRGMVDGTWGD